MDGVNERNAVARVDYRRMAGEGAGVREGGIRGWLADRPQMPYLLPFFAYLLLMAPGGLGEVAGVDFKGLWRRWHPVIYGGQSAAAGILLWYFWPVYARVRWSKLGLGVVMGLIGTVVWVGSEYLCQWVGMVQRPAGGDFYIPEVELGTRWAQWAYLIVRVAGPALVVPVMEELFFRDFLMRALIRGARFDDVAVGTFTWMSLLGMAAMFGVNHGYNFFVPGVLYGLMMGWIVIRTKSLGACIVAHGVTNWSLYLYVIWSGDWQFM